MNAGMIAEYVVGILVPLAMVWGMEEMGKGTSNPARGGSQNPKQSKGALPPLRSPFSNLAHHASCRSWRKSSVGAIGKAVRPPVYRIEIVVHRAGRKLRGAATVLGLLRSTLCHTFK